MILKISDRFKNRQITYFNDVTVDLKYDALASTFQLSYWFDPDNVEHKEFSCVSHYHICTLVEGPHTLLTGYILSILFEDDSERSLVKISGYSLTGFLEDCDIPPVIPPKYASRMSKTPPAYSLQHFGLTLRELAEKLAAPFGIKVIVDSSVSAEMNAVIEETEAKQTQSIRSYLSEVASQKNIIITHNEFGDMVFKRASSTQKPIFHFTAGVIGLIKMKFGFNGQAMHSHITIVKQADSDEGAQAGQETIENPYVPTVFRPKVISQSSGNDSDTRLAAINARAKELRNMPLTIILDRFILNDKVIRPGQIVSVTNPKVYIYKKTDFIIEHVSIKQDTKSTVCTLNCVIPEVFTGSETINNIFKGINLHPIE